MTEKVYDAAVIGCGAAGMAAALAIRQRGWQVAIVEREEFPGGILNQCIHNGFGLHEFREELSGPEYAERYIRQCLDSEIPQLLNTTVVRIEPQTGCRRLVCYSREYGVFSLSCRAIVLAMGCRERNRGNIGTAGTRPAGIFTAGLAQRFLNIDGCIPGKQVVIIGSGDIGLIMARRLSWVGSRVLGVVEIRPYPSGLTRNLVQCLQDFSIPLYLEHIVSGIFGRDRVERVQITPLKEHKPDYTRSFDLECDTVLLSVGLVPENELSHQAGIALNKDTGGPFVDGDYMTECSGIFACGNVLHVHDLVDFVSAEARCCGERVADFLDGRTDSAAGQIPVTAGANVRYVIPNRIDPARDNNLLLRSLVVSRDSRLVLRLAGVVVSEQRMTHVQPSEMIRVELNALTLCPPAGNAENPGLTVDLEM